MIKKNIVKTCVNHQSNHLYRNNVENVTSQLKNDSGKILE